MLQDNWLVFHVFWIVSTYWHVVKLSRSCRFDVAEVLKVIKRSLFGDYITTAVTVCFCMNTPHILLFTSSAFKVSSCLSLLPLLGTEHAFYAPKAVSY